MIPIICIVALLIMVAIIAAIIKKVFRKEIKNTGEWISISNTSIVIGGDGMSKGGDRWQTEVIADRLCRWCKKEITPGDLYQCTCGSRYHKQGRCKNDKTYCRQPGCGKELK